MSEDEDDIAQHYEEALIGLDDIVDGISDVTWHFNAFTNRTRRQVRELRRMLDTVLDACPADTITLLLLRGDPGLTRHIQRWQQKNGGLPAQTRHVDADQPRCPRCLGLVDLGSG